MCDDPRYREGVRLFQQEHWFEAHEVLESLWRETPRGPDRELLQGLIQLAVSLEHWRRGNPRGARGQWEKAQGHLAGLPAVPHGLALAELLAAFRALWDELDLPAAVAAQAAGQPWRRGDGPWPTPRWQASGEVAGPAPAA
jgi:predicted metal-dependent hydrolase